MKVTARDCPRITDAFLEQERRELGDWLFRQEYLCEFVDGVDSLFRTEDIDRAFSGDVEPLFGSGTAVNPVDDSIQTLTL